MEFSKKNTLQLKGIAIILMLFHHTFNGSQMYQAYDITFMPFSESLINHISWFGKECVSIFAFLSGYGLAISYRKNVKNDTNRRNWYTSRILSLYKNYWFVFGLSMIVCGLLNGLPYKTYFISGNKKLNCIYVFLDFLGLSHFFSTPSINGAWWYMGLALAIVILIPLLLYLNQKAGSFILLLGCILLPRIFGIGYQGNNAILTFVFVVVCGVVFAEGDVFSKIKHGRVIQNKFIDESVQFILMTAVMYLFYHMYMEIPVEQYYEFNYGIIAVGFIVYCYKFILRIPVLNNILEFLGKHSMNIFYVHIFIRVHYCMDFIYSFKYFILIIAVLTGISVLVSILIEQLKKIVHYDSLWTKFEIKILRNK